MLAPLHIRVCGSMLVVFLRVWCDRVVGSIGLVDAAKSRTSHVRAAVSVRAVAPPGCFLSSLNGIHHGDMRGLGVSKPLSSIQPLWGLPLSIHRHLTRSCILALKVTSRCTSKERDFGLDAEAPALSDESFPARQELTITAERRTRASQHLLSSYNVVLVA